MSYQANKLGDPNNLGFFATSAALEAAYPIGAPGYFAVVGETNTIWVWDGNTSSWIDSGCGGADAFVYIAYASDASGTGFTMTFNPALDYIAIKNTTVAIPSPSASDFVGLWKNYKGADGDSFVWKGLYSGATAYLPNDAVEYNGSSYMCKLTSTGNIPTNTTYWDLMAQKGTDGSGSGDFVGPASSVNNNLVAFADTTGKLGKDSGVKIATTLNQVNTEVPTSNAVFDFVNGNYVSKTTTVNGHSLSANVTVTASDVGAVATNTAITGATKTKITYDAKGLVTGGADATTADIADSTDKRYCTDAQKIVIGNTSGTNTGDNAVNTTSNTYADGKVEDAIVDGVTTKAPSQNAVFDALAGKQAVETATQIYSRDVICRVATTANITLSGAQTIDGVSVVAGDYVLVKNQSTASQNGVYVVNAGAWTRATEYSTTADFDKKDVFVTSGTAGVSTWWLSATKNVTVGTTSVTFAQIPNGIGTGADQAAAGNHTHASEALTAASSIGAAWSERYTSRTATASTATTDLVVRFSGSTASQIETMPDGVAVSNNSGRVIRYVNNATVAWVLRQSASNSLDGSTADLTILPGQWIQVYNIADNAWITVARGVISAVSDVGVTYTPAAAGTSTLDLAASAHHDITMPAGNITIAISNATARKKFLVSITQDATGSRTVTWFSTIRWVGGSAPTLTTTASKRDVFGFIATGTNTFDGFIVGQNI